MSIGDGKTVMIVGAGLPRPDVQVIVGKRGTKLIRVDCRFPGTPEVVELLGYRFHRTELQMRNDAERMNKMIAQGLLPTQFTYVHVRDHPNYVLATVIDNISRNPQIFTLLPPGPPSIQF